MKASLLKKKALLLRKRRYGRKTSALYFRRTSWKTMSRLLRRDICGRVAEKDYVGGAE